MSNVHVSYAGGGTHEHASQRDIPELDFETTPEYFRFGILPAYGLYARHVRDLVLDNVQFDLEKQDMRPAVVCDDVADLEIDGLKAQGNLEAECLLRLRQTRRAFIHGCRPLGDVNTFLQVEGDTCERISVMGNELWGVKNPVATGDGASPTAVHLQGGGVKFSA